MEAGKVANRELLTVNVGRSQPEVDGEGYPHAHGPVTLPGWYEANLLDGLGGRFEAVNLTIKKARHDLAILIGLLSLEEMSEAVSGDKENRYLASTRHNHHATAWGCRPDEFTTTKEQGADTLPWREGGRIVNTWCLMQGTGRSFK
ncbi:unnamed protein product [marine sediment metagenome]|uniref:Uncharacterized protein n=1 Tax=marine sediment metagenome TaxID=412755 RepID=X1HRE1_9ZZZZ